MAKQERFRTIDGLRGIAALAVVCYHLNGAVARTYGTRLPGGIETIFAHGYLGVDVFFVLSGFVIAYSIRNATVTWGFLGRFALRRSVRLDPPYWMAILLEIALISVGLGLGLSDAPIPSLKQFASHFLYLQNLLGYGDISDVFWTLCFEIQFYLGLVVLYLVHRQLAGIVERRVLYAATVLALAALFGLSLASRYGVMGLALPAGVALIRWFQFFMGVCVFWVVSGRAPFGVLVAAWVATVGVVAIQGKPWYQIVPVIVSALLLWSYRKDRMATLLSNRPIQLLGAISYSLYLFHAMIGWRFIRVTGIVAGSDPPLGIVVLVFCAGLGLSVASAWFLWKFLEQPALRISRWINLNPAQRILRPQPSTVRAPANLEADLRHVEPTPALLKKPDG